MSHLQKTYQTGVLIGNWNEDRAGGDVFLSTNCPSRTMRSYETEKRLYHNHGSHIMEKTRKGYSDSVPLGASCVEKGTLFDHKGGDFTHLQHRNRTSLLSKKRAIWESEAKSCTRGGGLSSTVKSGFVKPPSESYDIKRYPRKDSGGIFPEESHSQDRYKTIHRIDFHKY